MWGSYLSSFRFSYFLFSSFACSHTRVIGNSRRIRVHASRYTPNRPPRHSTHSRSSTPTHTHSSPNLYFAASPIVRLRSWQSGLCAHDQQREQSRDAFTLFVLVHSCRTVVAASHASAAITILYVCRHPTKHVTEDKRGQAASLNLSPAYLLTVVLGGRRGVR